MNVVHLTECGSYNEVVRRIGRIAVGVGPYGSLTADDALDQIVDAAIHFHERVRSIASLNVWYPTSHEYTRLSLKLMALPCWKRWFSWRLRRRVKQLQLEHRKAVMDAVLNAQGSIGDLRQ